MNHHFYVTGGTLATDTRSYVPRAADTELYKALSTGEFCYVLTPRQMGKSSLMVRVAARLRQEGTRVAVVDLTATGVNVTPSQWYSGLLARLASQLDLEDEFDHIGKANAELSPLAGWLAAIESVILRDESQQTVIFIDEIDVVRSLPFAADEFFAALRQCYNRRSEDPRWSRITFCLLGVATPSELISDPHITPFNIGRRIELDDFRDREADVLAEGLQHDAAQQLLQRVLHWTGGHPYLTQKLCSEIAAAENVTHPHDVDRVCHNVFLAPGAREQDDNLIFVRERLLRGESDLASLLHRYRRVFRQRSAADDEGPLSEALKLSGVVRADDGHLRVRNRIYEHVFDLTWIRSHMPDAELRRQRAAFLDGILRAAAVAAVIVLLLGSACAFAFYQWQSTVAALELAETNEQVARQQRQAAINAKLEAEGARVAVEAAKEQVDESLEREQAERQRAEQREREANDFRKQAEQQTKVAEQNYQAALESHRRMQLAFERLVEEQRSVEERGKLFLGIPAWLQAYSADAVARHARRQVEQGDPEAALRTYAELCDLALSGGDGFWVRELIRITPERLHELNLDADVLDTRIQVELGDVVSKVLEPGIALGEQRMSAGGADGTPSILATLYDCQARQLFQAPQPDDAAKHFANIVAIYDRAIELDDGRFSFYVGRAVARYSGSRSSLSDVRQDLETAIAQYPARPTPPESTEQITQAHRDVASLNHSLGNVVEQMAAPERAPLELLDKALLVHAAANNLNPQNVAYPVAMARVLRRKSERSGDRGLLSAAATSLARARKLNDQHPQLHNELGQHLLLTGDLNGACRHFDLAVRYGDLSDARENRYRYYCNRANAYLQRTASAVDLSVAAAAAEQAIALKMSDSSDALYYRGLARWGVSRQEGQSAEGSAQQQKLALASFDAALSANANHVGASLARCQLLLEAATATLPPEQLKTLRTDADRALARSTIAADQAKAHYVIGLCWLREHLDHKAEELLIEALRSMLLAAKTSDEYVPMVRDYFDHAKRRDWRSVELREQSGVLRQTYEEVARSESSD